MKIVLDAMGGDFAPKVNVDGAIDALREFDDIEIILAGPQELVEKTIGEYGDQAAYQSVKDRLSIVDAPEVITTEEHPVMALRRKKNSTFCVGMDIVRRKEAQAFVSAGSTGAVMAGAMFKIGRIKGIVRPALGAPLPVPGRTMLLVDAGANTDCKPEWINQFAMMGSIYMNRVMGVETPEVGLVNIGVEAAKGNEQAQKAYELMSKQDVY
ncbi:MAG: phosphate--acyl-ACP acyltransferase, partial [Eubacteriales bacterium]|nr:phosphate--acyl-ACP acyltransferase [Eubacteriales bacterium]